MYDYGFNSGSLVSLILSNQLNYSFSAVRTINVNPGVVGGAGGGLRGGWATHVNLTVTYIPGWGF